MKFSELPLGIGFTIIVTLDGATNPVRLTLAQLLLVGTIRCRPFSDQTELNFGSNDIPASPKTKLLYRLFVHRVFFTSALICSFTA